MEESQFPFDNRSGAGESFPGQLGSNHSAVSSPAGMKTLGI